MRLLYAVHIAAGAVSLLVGYVALFAAKGGTVHRRGGMVFVNAMLAMAVMGALIAAVKANNWSVVNIAAGMTTAYLVATSFVTVRQPAGWSRRLDAGLMLLALGIGGTMLAFGIRAAANGGSVNGVPAFPFFLFGIVGLLAAAGDARMLRAGRAHGTARVARHLWRMSFALFIAAMSFFIGQAKVIPQPIRIMPLLALPVLTVLVTMGYWLWRVRVRQSLRGIVHLRAADAA